MSTKGDAYSAAFEVAQGDRLVATVVMHEAERDVVRKLIAASLPGGLAEYWRLVCEEIKS